MASRASARRYARALFDVVSRSGDPEAALAELQSFVAVLNAYPDLRQALMSPGVPHGAKLNVTKELLKLQPLSKVVDRLVLLVVENDDVNEFDMIVQAFEQRVMDLIRVVRADVTTAAPLSAAQADALAAALAGTVGRRVVLATRVDPSILGGLVARIGSRVYDGSIARHLARVRERLVASEALQ